MSSTLERLGIMFARLSTAMFGIVVGTLTVTLTLKIVAVSKEVPFLGQEDPLMIFLSNRQVILLSSFLEIVVILVLCSGRSTSEKAITLAAFASVLCIYRLGLWLVGHKGPCSCLGGALGYLSISGGVVNVALNLLVALFIVISYALMLTDIANDGRTGAYQGNRSTGDGSGAMRAPDNSV